MRGIGFILIYVHLLELVVYYLTELEQEGMEILWLKIDLLFLMPFFFCSK